MIPDSIKPNLDRVLYALENDLEDSFWDNVSMFDKAHLAGSFVGGDESDYKSLKSKTFRRLKEIFIPYKNGYESDIDIITEPYMHTTIIKVYIKKKKQVSGDLVDISDLKGRYFQLAFVPEIRTDDGEERIEFMPFIFHASVIRSD